MEKTQLSSTTNKKTIIIITVIVIILLFGIILVLSRSNPPQSAQLPQPTSRPLTGIKQVHYEVDVAGLPAPAKEDFDKALSSNTDQESKFLTQDQLKELNSSSMVANTQSPEAQKTYTVSWSGTDVRSRVPPLPQSVPAYFVARPSDRSAFSVIKDIAGALGIKGSVIRTDGQHYSVGDIAGGTFPFTFDLDHMTFSAQALSIPSGTDGNSVKDYLTTAGLLNFPVTVSSGQKDTGGALWYRITPQLALPVVSMERPTSTFIPGKTGTIDVAVDKNNNITQIQSLFPNVVRKSTVALASADEIARRISSDFFTIGDIELAYPGATTLADKRRFFSLQNSGSIAVTNAEVNSIECGYFMETGTSLHALLTPVCIVSGRATAGGFPVILRVLVPAVE
jgi:hypothetical protein